MAAPRIGPAGDLRRRRSPPGHPRGLPL